MAIDSVHSHGECNCIWEYTKTSETDLQPSLTCLPRTGDFLGDRTFGVKSVTVLGKLMFTILSEAD